MAHDTSVGIPFKNRPDSSEDWDLQTLEAETRSSFSFQKAPGKGPASSTVPAPSSRPPPAPSPLIQPTVSPYFGQQTAFGASSAPPISNPQQHQHHKDSSSASSSSSTRPPSTRSHPPYAPFASASASSSNPPDPTLSKPWSSGPSQLLKRPESTRPPSGGGNAHAGGSASNHRPPTSPRGVSSSSQNTQQHVQQPLKQSRSSHSQQQPRTSGGGGDRAKSTSTTRRTDLEGRGEQDLLDDEGLGSSVGYPTGKGRAGGGGETVTSGQSGFGAFAGNKASFEPRLLAAATPSLRAVGDRAVSEFFASTPAPASDPAAMDDNSPPRPRALFSPHKDPAATHVPRKQMSNNPSISKAPPRRSSHSARPEDTSKQHHNTEVAGSPSRGFSGSRRSKPRPITRAGSVSSLEDPRVKAGDSARRRAPPEGGGASGSGARRPSVATGPGGGAPMKRTRDEAEPDEGNKENPRKKASRIVRDIEEITSQNEHRGEEINRLKHEVNNHEKKQRDLEGQVGTAKKLATEMRRRFADVEDTVTEIVKSKKDLDKSRADMSKELEGYQAAINDIHEWDNTKEDVLRSGSTWFDRQRDTLMDTIQPLRVAREDAEDRATKAEGSLEVLKRDLVNKASELAEKSNRVGSLEDAAEKKDEAIKGLGDNLMKMTKEHKSEVGELSKEITTLRALLTKSEGHASDLEGAIEESERELEGVKAQLAARDPELLVLHQKISGLEKTLGEKESLIADHQRDLGVQGKWIEAAKTLSETTKTDLARAHARQKELEGQLAQTVEDLKSARAEGKAAIDEKEKKIKTTQDALEKLKTEHNETCKQLAVTNTKLDERDKLVKAYEERVAELTNDKKNIEKSNEELQVRIHAVLSGESTSSNEAAHSRSEVETLARKLKVAQAANADSSAQLKRATSQVADLQKKIEATSSLDSRLAQAESQRDAVKKERAEWVKDQEEIKSELESSSESLAEKTKALESLQTKATADKESARRQLLDLQKEVHELQEKRRTLAERFASRTGMLDPEEGKTVDAIAATIDATYEKRNADHLNAMKKTETKTKALEREKKDLEAKLAKANVGKSRNLIEPDRYAQSSPPSEQDQEESLSGGQNKLDSPTSPSPQNATASSSDQPVLKSALRASSKMPPPPLPARPRPNDSRFAFQRSSDSSPLTAEDEAETQAMPVSSQRKGSGGVAVLRGAAAAEPSGSRKRVAGVEDLGGDHEGLTAKKTRSNSTGSTSNSSVSAPKYKPHTYATASSKRRGK